MALFITKDNVNDAFLESKRYMRPFYDPIQEWERIARNKPSANISPELPKTTDGTLASIIQEQPKRVIQQIPTGVTDCKDYPEYSQVAGLVLTDKLLPMENSNGNTLQKSWAMTNKALTYGSSASYSFFTNTNGVMHTDFVIPYIKDILIERGKVYGPDSNILFMRSWFSKRDIQAIIDKEKKLQEKDKKYTSDWDLKKLADWIEGGASSKDADLQTPAERERSGDTGGFEMIHAFQKGIDSEFYSFSPRYADGDVFRTKKNKDPRGNMPIDFMYCNIDLSNPLGRGQVELSGGVQNLIDQQMQMFQFLTTLMMGPPLQKWGNVNSSSLKFRPNAIWDMGNNPNNKVEAYAVNNTAITNFPTNHSMLQGQIYMLNSSSNNNVSAESGNAGQSKTQAGVKANDSRLGVSDNYLRKQFEAWFGDHCETAINIFFSEMSGKGDLELNNDQIKKLINTPAAKLISKDKKISIPYKDINDVVFRFAVDASSSEVKEDSDNVDKLTEIYKLLQSDPDPNLADKKMKLLKVLINEIGAEGTDELFPDEDPTNPQAQQAQQPHGPDPQMMQQMVQQMVQQEMAKQQDQFKLQQNQLKSRELDIKEKQVETDNAVKLHDSISKGEHLDRTHDLAESQHNLQTAQAVEQSVNQEAQQQPNPANDPLNPQEQQVVEALLHQGFNEQDAEQAIVMARSGVPEDQIMQHLQAKKGG